MIQRIQTVFLVIVFAITCTMLFLAFQSVNIVGSVYDLTLMPGNNRDIVSASIYVPISLNFLIMALSLVTIFQFKKRKLQIKLSNTLGFLNVGLLGALFILHYITDYSTPASYKVASFLPALGFLMAFLASYYIKKDEALVRSADRIR